MSFQSSLNMMNFQNCFYKRTVEFSNFKMLKVEVVLKQSWNIHSMHIVLYVQQP